MAGPFDDLIPAKPADRPAAAPAVAPAAAANPFADLVPAAAPASATPAAPLALGDAAGLPQARIDELAAAPYMQDQPSAIAQVLDSNFGFDGGSNVLSGVGARVNTALGSFVRGVANVSEPIADTLETAIPLSGLTPEQVANEKQLAPIYDLADFLTQNAEGYGYTPSTEIKDVKEAFDPGANEARRAAVAAFRDLPVEMVDEAAYQRLTIPQRIKTVAAFMAEQGITSLPDMAAAVANLPAYILARTEEIAERRVQNNASPEALESGEALPEPGLGDLALSAPAAVIESTLERFATGRLLPGRAPGSGTAVGRIGTETAVQGGTEGAEELIANLGESLGTRRGVDPTEAFDATLGGILGGTGIGGVTQTAKEGIGILQSLRNGAPEPPAAAPAPAGGPAPTPAAAPGPNVPPDGPVVRVGPDGVLDIGTVTGTPAPITGDAELDALLLRNLGDAAVPNPAAPESPAPAPAAASAPAAPAGAGGSVSPAGAVSSPRRAAPEAVDAALAMDEDAYIAAVNPSGKRSSAEDEIAFSAGDIQAPPEAVPAPDLSFTDKRGRPVEVVEAPDGTLYAQVDGKTVGLVESSNGETLNQVAKEFQGAGIGAGLIRAQLLRDPMTPAGSFSEAGEAARRSAFRQLRAERAPAPEALGSLVPARPVAEEITEGDLTASRNQNRTEPAVAGDAWDTAKILREKPVGAVSVIEGERTQSRPDGAHRWTKLQGERWTDGETTLDTNALARRFDDQDVIDGAARPEPKALGDATVPRAAPETGRDLTQTFGEGKLFARMGDRMVEVDSPEDASRKFLALKGATDIGGMSVVELVDGSGRAVGYLGQNGEVFEGDFQKRRIEGRKEPIYRPPGKAAKPSALIEADQPEALGDFAVPRETSAPARQPDRSLSFLRDEIGWAERGGRMIRGGEVETNPEAGASFGRAGGDVIGRTSWIPKTDPGGRPSTFWRNRPGRMTEAEAKTALDRYEAGEKLTKRQQAFIDYAKETAKGYDEDSRAEAAMLAEFDADEQQAAIAAFRDDQIDVAPEDEAEALALYELTARALEAGADDIDVAPFAGEPPRAHAARLWAIIRGTPNADARATPEDRGPGQEDRQDAPAPAASAPRPAGGLFGAPTARETVDAARRDRDAQRDGRTGTGRTDMASGAGELFAGPRPAQARIDEPPAAPPKPEAPPTPKPPTPPTSTKNAVQEAERAARGESPILKAVAKTNEETLAEAQATLDADPDAGREVVERLKTDGPAVISLADEAVLLVEKVRLRNERDAAAAVAGDENASASARAVARAKWEDAEARINDMDQATAASGREWGRLGQFRQRMLREDFTFAALERRERVRLERPLTADESASLKEYADRVQRLEARLQETQTALDDANSANDSAVAYKALLAEMAKSMSPFKPTKAKLQENAAASLAALRETVAESRAPVQTDSPAFRRWFGDSKVVDENGEPLVVYHGSTDARAKFAKGFGDDRGENLFPQAFFFSPDRGIAEGYGDAVTQAFLRLENPYIARTKADFDKIETEDPEATVRAMGHDGAILYIHPDGPPEYVVFDPPQIKSSTGNRGTFDPASDSILESRGVRRKDRPPLEQLDGGPRRSQLEADREFDDTLEGARRNVRQLQAAFSPEAKAIRAALGPAARHVVVLNSKADLDPKVAARVDFGGRTEGFFDPVTGRAYVFADVAKTPERAVWVAAHETAGHLGLRGMAQRQAGGDRAVASQALVASLDRAASNPTVQVLADKIAAENPDYTDTRATEEALAELAAAVRTGNYEGIESRYKVTVPAAQRAGLRGDITRLIQAIRAFLQALVGGDGRFTDAQVYQLLGDAWRYAETAPVGEAGSAGTAPESRRAGELRAFLEGSKVKGVVYHGTSGDFDAFDTTLGDLGAHFGTQQQANAAAGRNRGKGATSGPNVMPVHIRLTNPLRLKDTGSFHAWAIADQLQRKGIITKEQAAKFDADGWRGSKENNAIARDSIKAAGYDGIVYKNTQEGSGDSYIVFDAAQVKSATGNRGTFSPDSDSMVESRRAFSDGRGQRRIEHNGAVFVKRGDDYLLAVDGQPVDFFMVREAEAEADRVGGEVVQDAPIDGQRRTWSVRLPERVRRDAEREFVPESRAPLQTDTEAFRRWFGDSKVVDENGEPMRVYHGTKRPDRIGNRFRSARATSGPMAFFTDNPKLASNYATNKSDTSLEMPEHYRDWFKVKLPGQRAEVDIERAWHHLSSDQRADLADKLARVTNLTPDGDEADGFRLGDASERGGPSSAAHWDHLLQREHRGNALATAVDLWLSGGNLFGQEERFLDVLRTAGMPGDFRLDDPNAEFPAVIPVYLRISNPFTTEDVQSVLPALRRAAGRQRAPKFNVGVDQWDKRAQDPRVWLQRLEDDIEKGTTHAWTSIPDWVTNVLRDAGHDGIQDVSGKMGGEEHAVWIPFSDDQVKSAIGNRGTFKPEKTSILESRAPIDPVQFFHLSRIGALPVSEGVTDFAAWSARMKADLGDKLFASVESALPEVFEASKLQATGRSGERAIDPENITSRDVSDLARKHIQAGVRGEDAVMKAVHADIKELDPEMTERDVRRLFSEYGKVNFPSKDQDKVLLRELRSLVQIQESIDRLTEGLAALKSGPQRDKATQAIREKRRVLNDLLKQKVKAGGQSPETLATYQQARIRNLQNQIEDLNKQIATGERPKRAKAPAPSLELQTLIAQRDALQAERDEIDSPRSVRENEAKKRALKKQIEVIQAKLAGKAKPKPGAVQGPDDAAVTALRNELAKARAALKAATRKPRLSPEEAFQRTQAKSIQRQLNDVQARLAANDYARRPRPEPKELNEENTRAKVALMKVKAEFARRQFESEMAKRHPVRKILGAGAEAINLSRAYLTGLDFSALLRQGGFIALGHPVRAVQAVPGALRAFGSEAGAVAAADEVFSRPNARLYKKYGLELTQDGGISLSKMEETFMSRWLQRMPRFLAGGLVRGSGRAFTATLNRIRADSFDAMAAALGLSRVLTDAEGEAIANYINVATGRGHIGRTNAGATGLNTVFFAPRLVASRVNLLALQPLYGGTARTRLMIAQEYARFLMGVAVVFGLAALAADEDDDEPLVTLDPRSSNFLKIKFNNTYIDPMTGLSQVTVFLARMLTGETVSGAGQVTPIRTQYRLSDFYADDPLPAEIPYGRDDAFDVSARFARTKFAPIPGTIATIATGENWDGSPVTTGSVVTSLVVPISFQDIHGIMTDNGLPKGAGVFLLSMLGMGVQYREPDINTIRNRLADTADDELEAEFERLRADYPADVTAGQTLDRYVHNAQNRREGRAGKVKRDDQGRPKFKVTEAEAIEPATTQPVSRAMPVEVGNRSGKPQPFPFVGSGLRNAPKMVTVGDWSSLPAPVRKAFDDGAEGAYDAGSNTAYVVAGLDPARAKLVAFHEIAGHHGLQKTLGEDYEAVLNRARQNPVVETLANAMRDRAYGRTGVVNRLQLTEEALSELAAAAQTGDYTGVEAWGVKVPPSARAGLQGVIGRSVQATKRKVATMLGEEPEAFDDDQVQALLRDAWDEVKGKPLP